MKNAFYSRLLGVAITIASLSQLSCVKQPKLRAINLIWKTQFVSMETGKLIDLRDTTLLVYYGDLFIYRAKYDYVKYNSNALHGDTMVVSDDPKSIDYKEVRYDYYIWREGATRGIHYSGDTDSAVVVSVDSVKKKKLLKDAQLFNTDYDRLFSVQKDARNKSFLETYVNVKKPDDSYPDTTQYRFSSDFDDIPYSLDKKADSIKGSKMTEVRFVYNAAPNGFAEKVDLPKRELHYKIVKASLDRAFDVEGLKNRFYADERKKGIKNRKRV